MGGCVGSVNWRTASAISPSVAVTYEIPSIIGVAPSRCAWYTFDVSTWKASSTSGWSFLRELRSDLVSPVMPLISLMTLVQSLLQRADCRCVSLRKSCCRCIRVKSPF